MELLTMVRDFTDRGQYDIVLRVQDLGEPCHGRMVGVLSRSCYCHTIGSQTDTWILDLDMDFKLRVWFFFGYLDFSFLSPVLLSFVTKSVSNKSYTNVRRRTGRYNDG